jgi:hypothetical protein
LAVGLALMAAAACADDGPWQKPNVSAEQLARDRAACRREATAEVERDLVLAEERSPGTRDSRTGAYMAQMNRFSAGRDRDALYERCMMRLGYKRGAGSDAESRFEALSEPPATPQSGPESR